MRTSPFRSIPLLSFLCSSFLFSCAVYAHEKPVVEQKPVNNIPALATLAQSLPPLPEGVSELSFNEFFKMPIGPQGLEPTEKLLKLHNKRVRILGYMAHEDDPTPGIFMLAARPVNVGEKADGMADDLPAATLFVHMPEQDSGKVLTYRPAPWLLTGTLQVGNQVEVSDRISFVRLLVDQPELIDQQKNKKEKGSDRARDTRKVSQKNS